jgi:4-hydroxy-tetrahydrodipicolinate synthase
MTLPSAPVAPFGRVLTAMATAFTVDGEIDEEATARIALHLVDHGHDGLVVSGTTGEAATTTTAEDGRILRAVKDAVGDRAKIIAGVGTNDTRHTLELARQAVMQGADGLLLVTPYYNKPSQGGIHARLQPALRAVMGVPNYGATTVKGALQLLAVLQNRTVRSPLLALDDGEYEALRTGLLASDLLR